MARLAAAAALGDLDAAITCCRACPRLVSWREEVALTKRAGFADQPYWGRPVAGFGDREASTLIVGLAPAAHGANRTGRLFTGDQSGEFLYAGLYRAGCASRPTAVAAGDGLELQGVRIISAVRCAPPDNKPTTIERDTCSPWMDAELALLAPSLKVILALGDFGWDATLRSARRLGWDVPRPKPRFGHGNEAQLGLPDGREITLLGCFHVSQRNTFTGKLTEEMLDAVLARMQEITG